jgi:cytochrome c-type biogenesis protein CcsB
VAARSEEGHAGYGGSTVGAAQVLQAPARPERRGGSRPDGYTDPSAGSGGDEQAYASPLAQRAALSPVAFPLVPLVVVAAFVLIVWRDPVATLVAGSAAALLGTATWYAVPYLPPAAKLDSLAYRVVAFGFPVWTFAVMAGAIWAQEAWGRYWGWDPKETGSFFTWLLYASYLHARSTRGWRGRGAAWIGVIAFVALMVTYYAVNLFIVGLHSYAGV